jgi:hypothetical protein
LKSLEKKGYMAKHDRRRTGRLQRECALPKEYTTEMKNLQVPFFFDFLNGTAIFWKRPSKSSFPFFFTTTKGNSL